LFFHDIVNTAGTLQGYSRLILSKSPHDWPDHKSLAQLADLADQLVDEIRAQRDLTYAESGDLEPEFEPVNSRDLLERLRLAYERHPVGRDREIRFDKVWNGNFISDHRLLSRVLGNMLKNALEATPPGGTVTLGCRDGGHEIVFRVHNAAVMSPQVQMQIFQRSFSTKGSSGRGVGTHSMRLLGERYLGGRVTFTSHDPQGTTFTISLPNIPANRTAPRSAK
jgi:signal transduction histidine kinase